MEHVGFNMHILHSRSCELPAVLSVCKERLMIPAGGCVTRCQGVRCVSPGLAAALLWHMQPYHSTAGVHLPWNNLSWRQREQRLQPGGTCLHSAEWCWGLWDRLSAPGCARTPGPLGDTGDGSRGCCSGVAAGSSSLGRSFRNPRVLLLSFLVFCFDPFSASFLLLLKVLGRCFQPLPCC